MESFNQAEQKLTSKTDFNEKRLRVTPVEISVHGGSEIIGSNQTYLALKSPNTYMIATNKKGLEVVKDGEKVYSADLPAKEEGKFNGIFYAAHLDSFFMLHQGQLYQKTIDEKETSVYMDLTFLGKGPQNIRYSQLNRKLFIFFVNKDIKIIDIDQKNVDWELRHSDDEYLEDLKIFGENEEKIVSMTDDGRLLLHILSYSQKEIISFNKHKIDLIQERDETPVTLAVDNKSQFIFAGLQSSGFDSSRILIFRVKGNNELSQRAVLDEYGRNIRIKAAPCCLGYSGVHVLWAALEHVSPERLQVYAYNIKARTLSELEDKRVNHRESCPEQFSLLRDQIYYRGGNGKVIKLQVNL